MTSPEPPFPDVEPAALIDGVEPGWPEPHGDAAPAQPDDAEGEL